MCPGAEISCETARLTQVTAVSGSEQSLQSGFLIAIVRNNFVPLLRGRAGDEGDDRFGLAHIKDFVGDARFDVDEIAGFIFQDLLEAATELMPHFALYYIEDELEADMDVGFGYSAGRDGGDVRGEFRRADVFRRHALFVMNAVPITARAAAADGQDAIMVFDSVELDRGVRVHMGNISQGTRGEKRFDSRHLSSRATFPGMNRVMHFEIYRNDPDAVRAFYDDVFGWKFQKYAAKVRRSWNAATNLRKG